MCVVVVPDSFSYINQYFSIHDVDWDRYHNCLNVGHKELFKSFQSIYLVWTKWYQNLYFILFHPLDKKTDLIPMVALLMVFSTD